MSDLRKKSPGINAETSSFETKAGTGESTSSAAADKTLGDYSLLRNGDPRKLFGDYEIIRELGRGAMGIVYLARQRTVNRHVALKIIRTDVLGDEDAPQRFEVATRFRTEAQAAANIHHDHIVTVYEVGEIEGQPFFSMQYVEGENLLTLLLDGPIEGRQAAQYLEPVARAVHTAHGAGILHRDLKPQNILIDEQGRALVADFGLAKLVEDDGGLTHDGEVMGTPQYMSPEQSMNPSGVTALADVYSLGATLYHTLTGRPPFQAVTALETLRQVMFQEPVAPRQLSPTIDQDLETICLKCLQKEPSRRYASAEALADELSRYLSSEPIVARPISRWERSQRWIRRNPAVAALLAATFISLLTALLVTSGAYVKTAAAQRRSEAGFREARRAVNHFFTRVSEDVLLDEPGMQLLRKDLLQEALTFYQAFLAREEFDPGLQDEIATTYYRIGRITEATEDAAAAISWYERARDAQRLRRSQTSGDMQSLAELGDTLNALGAAFAKMEKFDEASSALEESIELRQESYKNSKDPTESRRKLANSLMNLGLVQRRKGNLAEAMHQMQGAQAIRQELLSGDPNESSLLRDLAIGYYNLANAAIAGDTLTEAERYLETGAITAMQELLARDDVVITDRYRMAICQRRLADLKEDISEASSLYEAAVAELETLTRANPAVIAYQRELATAILHRAELELDTEAQASALDFFQKGEAVLKRMLNIQPSSDLIPELAEVQLTIGELQLAAGEVSQARKAFENAKRHLSDFLATQPDDPSLSALSAKTTALLQSLPSVE